jgi:hypothetical protein
MKLVLAGILGFPEPAVRDCRFLQKFGPTFVAFVVDLTGSLFAKLEILNQLVVFLLFSCSHSLLNNYFVDLEFMKSAD